MKKSVGSRVRYTTLNFTASMSQRPYFVTGRGIGWARRLARVSLFVRWLPATIQADDWRCEVDESPAPSFTWQVVTAGRDGPGPRSRHCLAHDAATGATVLFGGILWEHQDGTLCDDTWELRGGRWSRIRFWWGPAARHRGAMVPDDRRGGLVLFGGQGGDGRMLGDTWTYAGRRWRKWNPRGADRPAPRCGHAMAYDEAAQVVVLFGGLDRADHSLGDTWLFDGDSWHRVRGTGPPARRYAALAYDPELKGCLLHGGSDDESSHSGFGDVWLLLGLRPFRLPGGFDTEPRDDHCLAYHRYAGRLVMLEGVAGARGLMVRGAEGWLPAAVAPLHPRHQCSPLAWDGGLGGLVLHGGEVHHAGPQFDATLVLRRSP